MMPQPHLEKLRATLANDKLPAEDRPRLEAAIKRYEAWVAALAAVSKPDVREMVVELTALLNNYRNYLDVEVIFDSDKDFLYRQKGQIKLDNSVIEEFLPYLVRKCVLSSTSDKTIEVGPNNAFSAIYFTSALDTPSVGGGLHVRTKDQDFVVARRVFLKTSYSSTFATSETSNFVIAYIAAECKTNLDKTMFQEAAATAHDVKTAVAGARYYLLCEWLDMTPQSTAATDIDEVLILRKAKRMNSNLRANFGSAAGRRQNRSSYVAFLNANPFSSEMFLRLVGHIAGMLNVIDPGETSVLNKGYF
jgi:hypothetical protein